MQKESRREELLAHINVLSPKERLVLTLRHGVSDNIPKRIVDVAEFLNRAGDNVEELLIAGTRIVFGTQAGVILVTSTEIGANPRARAEEEWC